VRSSHHSWLRVVNTILFPFVRQSDDDSTAFFFCPEFSLKEAETSALLATYFLESVWRSGRPAFPLRVAA